jgi:hypothetical protein
MHTLSALSAYPASFRHIRRLAALAALTAAAGAHAGGGVSWSVNVDMPMAPMGRVVTAVSNVPAPVVYRSEPVYVQQQPVYVQQQPVYQGPSRVVYAPAPVMVVSEPRRCPPPVWWGHGHERREWRESRWDRWDRGGERIMIVPRAWRRRSWGWPPSRPRRLPPPLMRFSGGGWCCRPGWSPARRG